MRHFNTKSKKFSVTVNFIQKETKKGSKKGNVIFSISRSFRPLSDDSRSFRKISEVFQGEIRKFSTTVWHEIFAGSYSFASFAIFQAIRKNKFPQIKNTANIFPAKIFATVNILYNLNLLHKQNGIQ